MTNGWSAVDKWPKLLKMLADWGGGMAPCPPLDPPLINRQNKEMEGGGRGLASGDNYNQFIERKNIDNLFIIKYQMVTKF